MLFEKREYSKLLSNIFLNQFELLKFYHIEEILFDSVKMEMLFQKMDYDIMKIYLKRIGQMYEDNTDYELDYENILDVIEEYLICEIEDTVGEIVENDLYNIADRVLDNAERQEIEDFKEGRGDSLIEKMNLEVHRKIIGVSNKLIDGISDNIIINKLDLYEIESNIEIEEYLKESIDYLDDIESVYTLNNKSHLNETQEVDAIFERNLEKR